MTNKETYVESISWRGRLPAWIILQKLTLSQKLEQPTCVHSHEIFIHNMYLGKPAALLKT
jgi:hypothetical protein